jgi:signal transduction histidine kinase
MEGVAAWFSRKRQLALTLADLAVAVIFTGGALADVAALGSGAPLLAATVLSVACTTCVAWRRRAPAASVLVSVTAMLAYYRCTADPQMTFEPYAVALCYYLLGRQRPSGPGRAVRWLLIAYGLVALGFEFTGSAGSLLLQTATGGAVFVFLPFFLGLLAARYAALSRTLTATLAQLKREQDWRVQHAAAEERNRVARELHDVLGHCVSVMVIQAGAAGLVAQTDVAGARGALDAVVACGREALGDLRRIMGVASRDGALAEPVPGLAQLRSLAERATDAGIPTDLRIECGNVGLPAAVELTCYRVVQEALTNVVKHAGAARAEVRVRAESGVVVVTVADTGRGSAAVAADPDDPSGAVVPAESGYGITGLRERVALHGGFLAAGPRAGGYLVEARIPAAGGPPAVYGDVPRDHPPRGTGDAAALTGAHAVLPRLRDLRDLHRLRGLERSWLDPVLAGCWLVALEAEALTSHHRRGPLALSAVLVGAAALAGLGRRRAPLAFLVVTGLLSLPLGHGLASRDYATLFGVYGVLVPPYAVGAWERRRAWAVAAMLIWAITATAVGLTQQAAFSGLAGPLLAAGTAWSAGAAVRAQRGLAARLRETTSRLAAERAERARLAAADERARIARDLHLLVARNVAAMMVQAEAARELLGAGPAGALAPIAAVEEAGREALAEMRRILGVLRRPAEVRSGPREVLV